MRTGAALFGAGCALLALAALIGARAERGARLSHADPEISPVGYAASENANAGSLLVPQLIAVAGFVLGACGVAIDVSQNGNLMPISAEHAQACLIKPDGLSFAPARHRGRAIASLMARADALAAQAKQQ